MCCSVFQCVAVCVSSLLQCVLQDRAPLQCVGVYISDIGLFYERKRYGSVSLQHILQHTATHGDTLQHTVTHRNTLQRNATHCNTLQHTATHYSAMDLRRCNTHCNALQHTIPHYVEQKLKHLDCVVLQHTATRCNTLQHVATRCNTLSATALWPYNTLQQSTPC